MKRPLEWARRTIGGDHDSTIASETEIDENPPVPMTPTEVLAALRKVTP